VFRTRCLMVVYYYYRRRSCPEVPGSETARHPRCVIGRSCRRAHCTCLLICFIPTSVSRAGCSVVAHKLVQRRKSWGAGPSGGHYVSSDLFHPDLGFEGRLLRRGAQAGAAAQKLGCRPVGWPLRCARAAHFSLHEAHFTPTTFHHPSPLTYHHHHHHHTPPLTTPHHHTPPLTTTHHYYPPPPTTTQHRSPHATTQPHPDLPCY
jgi:hypothetical protein